MTIISVSYRTDIPAFYGEWFMQRVREGYVRYHNPYGPQTVTLSLHPQDVHAIILWSRNYTPFLKHLDELDARGFRLYFHYTLTGLPRLIEERVPPVAQAIQSFRQLAARYSAAHVQWRYDPILFSPLTDLAWHRQTFEALAEQLAGATYRCYFSFLDQYEKVEHNLRGLPPELVVIDPPEAEKLALATELAAIGAAHKISLYTCHEDFAAIPPIQRGACVDKALLDQLWPEHARQLKRSANRGGCGCYDHRDIGAYDSCPHGCRYCYAVRNRSRAIQQYQAHDPQHDALLKRTPHERPSPPPDDQPIQLALF